MTNPSRVLYFLLGVLGVLACSSAFADPLDHYSWYASNDPKAVKSQYSGGTQACEGAAGFRTASQQSTYPYTDSVASGTDVQNCRQTSSPTAADYQKLVYANGQRQAFCADGSFAVIGNPPATQCPTAPKPDCSNKAEQSGYQQWPTLADAMKSTAPMPTQIAWCMVKISSVTGCYEDTATKVARCYYKYSNTGDLAASQNMSTAAGAYGGTAANSTPSNMPPSTGSASTDYKCPTGSVSGGMSPDGMNICVGTGTNPTPAPTAPTKTTAPTVSVTNADGSTTTKTTTTTKNSDGSTTTVVDSVTTMPDGTKTTGQTADTSSNTKGDPGKYDNPKDQDDLCKRNPLLSICKNSTVTGTCEATTCDGDAIQCATLRAAAAMRCQQKADSDEVKASSAFNLGTAMGNGTDPLSTAFPSKTNGSQVTVASSLDTSGWLGGGACFSDKTFTVQGRTITFQLSKYCDYLLAFRYALMVVASLISLRILSGAVLT